MDINKPKVKKTSTAAGNQKVSPKEPIFDASPNSMKPRHIKETKIWRETAGAISQIWSNYLSMLKSSFQRLSREEQNQYIIRFSQILSVGSVTLGALFIYQFLDRTIRIFAFPISLVAAWLFGTRIVSAVLIKRFEKYLN